MKRDSVKLVKHHPRYFMIFLKIQLSIMFVQNTPKKWIEGKHIWNTRLWKKPSPSSCRTCSFCAKSSSSALSRSKSLAPDGRQRSVALEVGLCWWLFWVGFPGGFAIAGFQRLRFRVAYLVVVLFGGFWVYSCFLAVNDGFWVVFGQLLKRTCSDFHASCCKLNKK